MALQKSITLPNGVAGNYIRLASYRIDKMGKEAAAQFFLFLNATQAANAPNAPLCMIAQLNIFDGIKFDSYFGGDANIETQFYAAAKAEPLFAGGGLTNDQLSLSDALDV